MIDSHSTTYILHVTSWTLIGLGIVTNARQRIGVTVTVYAQGKAVAAKLVSPTDVDVKGEQLND